jgi:hypothetical protein
VIANSTRLRTARCEGEKLETTMLHRASTAMVLLLACDASAQAGTYSKAPEQKNETFLFRGGRPLGWNAGFAAGAKVIDYSVDAERCPVSLSAADPRPLRRARAPDLCQRDYDGPSNASARNVLRGGERAVGSQAAQGHGYRSAREIGFRMVDSEGDRRLAATLSPPVPHMVAGMMTSFVVAPPEVGEAALTPNGGTVDVTPAARGGGHH